MVFTLDNYFIIEDGAYNQAHFTYTTADTKMSTQNISLITKPLSDISKSQGEYYIAQLEQLIQQFNDRFDTLTGEFSITLDQLTERATKVDSDLADLQEKIDTLLATANNFQKYKLTLDTGSAFTLADIKPTPTNYALIGLRQRGWVYLTDVETQTMTDYASLPTQMKTDAHRIFNMPADGNGVIQIIFNASYMCWRRVNNSGVSSAWQLMATSADIANLTNVVNNLNTDLTGKIEQEQAVNEEQEAKLTTLTNYINATRVETRLDLPNTLFSDNMISLQSRGGVVTIHGTAKLAKTVKFSEILVEDMGVEFKNIGQRSAIFTGVISNNSVVQIYVEAGTAKLRSNSDIPSGSWLTLGGSYLTELPTLQ